jgi:hypothetical protein
VSSQLQEVAPLGSCSWEAQKTPAYQDGGDNQSGVEEAVRDVGGIETAVHAEALCHVPLANLGRPMGEGLEDMGKEEPGPLSL